MHLSVSWIALLSPIEPTQISGGGSKFQSSQIVLKCQRPSVLHSFFPFQSLWLSHTLFCLQRPCRHSQANGRQRAPARWCLGTAASKQKGGRGNQQNEGARHLCGPSPWAPEGDAAADFYSTIPLSLSLPALCCFTAESGRLPHTDSFAGDQCTRQLFFCFSIQITIMKAFFVCLFVL
jgi:hypothetical protein